MSCRDVEEHDLLDRHVHGTLPEEQRDAFERHVLGCDRGAGRLETTLALRELLRGGRGPASI